MRKYHQSQILALIKTIEEAQSRQLYSDCQEGALAICDFIEGIMGEETNTSRLLIEYCELLFKVHSGEANQKNLRSQLIKVQNSVYSELKSTRFEVAFISYKAAMSDSLESIYLAAKADPSCDVFWIPMPNYEVNPNGTLGRMHYEGIGYYDDIFEITDWERYDIESRMPDVIFTNYPYDNNTSNISIHPNFYSIRLRNYCDLLVHVPYYSAGNSTSEYYSSLPGVLFADYVIVASDIVRDSHIANFKKHGMEFNWKGRFGKAEEKFVALGSPKLDKVINAKIENYPIPEEWERLIQRTDGTRKKVILFNTHMFIWINNQEKYFKKLDIIFDTFRKNNDVVLWWRPHPSTELNFRIKAPHLYNKYESVVDGYKHGAWGIYDDTPDLHRAIAWADGYYGDASSVGTLCMARKLPILFNNLHHLKSEREPVLSNFYVLDNCTLLHIKTLNKLFRVSKAGEVVEHVLDIGGTLNPKTLHHAPYTKPVEHNGIHYFPALTTDSFLLYHSQDETFRHIAYDSKPDIELAFSGVAAHGNFVYFMPFNYPAIARMNVNTREIAYFSDWIEPVKKLTSTPQDAFFFAPVVVGDHIWAATCCGNGVLMFDTKTCKSKVYTVGKKSYRYNNIVFDGENFWLIPRTNTDTPVIKWNPQKGIIKEFSQLYAEKNPASNNSFNGFYLNGYIWLMPLHSAHALKICVTTDDMGIVNDFEADCNEARARQKKFDISALHGDHIYAYKARNQTLIVYNAETKERSDNPMRYPADISEILCKEFKKISHHFFSGHNKEGIVGLNGLIDYIQAIPQDIDCADGLDGINIRPDGSSGENIHDYIKGLIF